MRLRSNFPLLRLCGVETFDRFPADARRTTCGAAGPGWGGGTACPVIRYCFTEAAAVTTRVTSWGCETAAACDAWTSVTCAPARSAM